MPTTKSKVELTIPEELREVLRKGWQGTLELDARVVSAKGDTVSLEVNGVYPAQAPETPEEEVYSEAAEEHLGLAE